jgi:hypothetical protein
MAVTNARQYHQQMVHYLRKTITKADDGNEITIGMIPAGSVIMKPMSGVMVHAVFNAATTNVLDVGANGGDTGAADDPDRWATDLALGALGFVPLDENVTYRVSQDTIITASVDLTGTAATTGEAEVIICYIPDNDG